MDISQLMVFHIGAGVIALFAGMVALFSKKGYRVHRVAGVSFVAGMLILLVSALYVEMTMTDKPEALDGGTLTLYLLASAWMTVRRKEGTIGWFEKIAILMPVYVFIQALTLGLDPDNMEKGLLPDGNPIQMAYIFASVTAIMVVTDLKLILRGGISGRQRIARHLWRMLLALEMATTIFFLSQTQVLPQFLVDTNIYIFLAFVPLLMMLFWLPKVRLTKWWRED